MWLHLSPDANLVAVVEDAKVDHGAGLIGLRVPEQSHREHRRPCLCVAALLCQCVMSLPRNGRQWVYRLQSDAERAPESVADRDQTEEYEITAPILKRAGGRISLSRDGFLDVEDGLKTDIKVLHKKGEIPREPCEEQRIWHRNGDEWLIRDEYRSAIR